MRTGSSSAIYKDRDQDDLMVSTRLKGKAAHQVKEQSATKIILCSQLIYLKKRNKKENQVQEQRFLSKNFRNK